MFKQIGERVVDLLPDWLTRDPLIPRQRNDKQEGSEYYAYLIAERAKNAQVAADIGHQAVAAEQKPD